MKQSYHHGDLRHTILDAAVQAIEQQGIDGWSLRELARRAGVSHAAPAHHFGDRTGLLTAVAEQGFALLADALSREDDFLEMGLAYIAFAASHPAHFLVMFQPKSYRFDDPTLRAAEQRAASFLERGARGVAADSEHLALAAWSIAHGFAGLWLGGALSVPDGADVLARARPVLRELLRPR